MAGIRTEVAGSRPRRTADRGLGAGARLAPAGSRDVAPDGKGDVLDAILTGVLSRKVIRYSCVGATGRSERGHLAPFAVAIHKHGLYVGERTPERTRAEAAAGLTG
ncbi:MAG: hypothetical protein KJZ91_26360, partial [Myxococcales bacterium]|nr:hypothetical protein [Myxococcales bacterium]